MDLWLSSGTALEALCVSVSVCVCVSDFLVINNLGFYSFLLKFCGSYVGNEGLAAQEKS